MDGTFCQVQITIVLISVRRGTLRVRRGTLRVEGVAWHALGFGLVLNCRWSEHFSFLVDKFELDGFGLNDVVSLV